MGKKDNKSIRKNYLWIIVSLIVFILIILLVSFFSSFKTDAFSNDRTCLTDKDCKWTCTCGCISKIAYCSELWDCIYPGSCECVEGQCQSKLQT